MPDKVNPHSAKESSNNTLRETPVNVPRVQPLEGPPMKVTDLTSADEAKFTGKKRVHDEENVRPVSPPMSSALARSDDKPPSAKVIGNFWRLKRQCVEADEWHKNTPRRDAASPTPSDGHDTIATYDPKMNCNKIRSLIQKLIDSGEYKVTHFQRETGIASNSYGRFMKLKGPWNGKDNQTYDAAYRFFKQREKKGIKTGATGANKKRKSNDGSAVSDNAQGASSSKQAAEKKPSSDDFDVSDIHLDSEDNNAVPVHDTPGEIRRKISAHIPKAGCTLADFCRTISKSYINPQREVTARHLKTFRGQKGPDAGNMSPVYYAAFVYFEKLRLKQKKPKSNHRVEMEKRFPNGYWLDEAGPSTGRLFMVDGETFSSTKYGEVELYPRGAGSPKIINGANSN